MANKVLLKKSSVAAKVPLTTDLDYGELALNYADGKLYFKNASNVIKSFTIDDSVVTLTGTQTLTNKTLTSPTINGGALSGTFSGAATLSGAITLSNTTASTSTSSGALTIGGGLGVAGSIYADQIRLTNNGNGTNVYIGDDVMLGDVNAANSLGIRGIQDATKGYIVFGNANSTAYIGRDGTNPITVYGGQFSVNGTVANGGAALQLTGYANKGGTGYHDFLSVTSTYGTATNPNKFFRLNSTGQLEIINSAYTATIFTLTDAGVLSVPQISAGGSTGTNGQVLASTGTGMQWISVGGTGTVTSVGLSLPSIFTVSGSPITGAGTLTATLASQTANTFLAAPNGAAGAPTMRAIVAADIPTLNQNTTGSAATVTGASQTAITSAANLATVGTITTGVWNAGAVTSSGGVQGTTLTSTVATGTAPLTVTSTTKVANLNVEQVDGYHADTANTASTIAVRDASKNLAFSAAVLSGSTSGTTTLQATAAASGTLTLPAATDTLVGRATTDTLTNKTLTNPVVNNIKWGIDQIATAAGTTTLTVSSNHQQRFTGTTTQTVVMPVTSTLTAGMTYAIENASTGNITVNSSGGNLIATVIPGTTMDFTCIGTTLTTAADWDAEIRAFATITGTGACVLATSPTLVTPALGTPSSGNLANCTFPTLNQNTTGSAATLTTGRTIGITGDLTWTSPSFNGSANVTAVGTLATVNSNVGTFGSSSAIPIVTVNAKGLVTAVSTASISQTKNLIVGVRTGTSITLPLTGASTVTVYGRSGNTSVPLSL